jgi:hypothetical protein
MRLIPKFLQGTLAPTFCLWFCILSYSAVAALTPAEASPRSDFASRLTFPFIMAWWVMSDAQKRGRKLCYDFDSFVFFVWPLVVPAYLFQTRGVRAFLTLLCFGGMLLSGVIIAAVIELILDF